MNAWDSTTTAIPKRTIKAKRDTPQKVLILVTTSIVVTVSYHRRV